MPGGDPSREAGPASGPTATKRSQTVSMVLVAGAGLTALSLGSLTRGVPTEDVLVYPDAAACVAEGIRPAVECRSEYDIARAAYPRTTPHYDTQATCERHHGGSRCLPDPGATDAQRFVPRMAGYMIGRSAAQRVTPEPVYDHASGRGGRYCTGSGAKIGTGSGGSASSGKLTAAASKGSSTAGTSFGGFGESGRGFSSFGG